MRALALAACLAACGGSPSTTARPVTASGSDDASSEDWRGYLSQLIGTWSFAGEVSYTQTCRWIPDATFIVCKAASDANTWLIGWEPHNRRYVWWTVGADGTVEVFPGTVGSAEWRFENAQARMILRREQPTRWSQKLEAAGGTVLLAGVLTTDTAPAPASPAAPAAPTTTDWRSPLEGFVASWTFEGTGAGQPITFRETCRWVTGATFVLCKHDDKKDFALFGWEPHNSRFVHYGIEADGTTSAMVGTLANKTWTFTGQTERFTLVRETGLRMTVKVEEKSLRGGWTAIVDGALTTQLE